MPKRKRQPTSVEVFQDANNGANALIYRVARVHPAPFSRRELIYRLFRSSDLKALEEARKFVNPASISWQAPAIKVAGDAYIHIDFQDTPWLEPNAEVAREIGVDEWPEFHLWLAAHRANAHDVDKVMRTLNWLSGQEDAIAVAFTWWPVFKTLQNRSDAVTRITKHPKAPPNLGGMLSLLRETAQIVRQWHFSPSFLGETKKSIWIQLKYGYLHHLPCSLDREG